MTKSNRMYLLAAIFFIVAPLSVSGDASTGIKYVRLALTAAMVGVGIFVYQAESFRSTSKAFVFFAVFFTAGALWCDKIGWGIFNKGMFLMATLSGVYMAYTTKSEEQLSAGLKLLALSGMIAGFLLFGAYLANPEDNTAGDRLAVGGMNANTIGAAAGPMFIFSFFLGLWQTEFKLRIISFVSSILLAIVILGSGSRGATLMAIVGTLIATKPFLQKKASTVILCVAIPLGGLQIVALTTGESVLSKIPGAERIFEGGNKKNTRDGMWTWTFKQYKKSPIIGIGWLHFGNSSANCHNAFLQILTEVGIIGSAIFLSFFVQFLVRMRDVKYDLQGTSHPELVALPVGLLASLGIHGMVEASVLLGTTALPILLGYSVALVDRLPDILNKENGPQPTEAAKPAIPRLEIRSARDWREQQART